VIDREQKSYLVFISHSEKDRWIAKQMAALIEERGRKHSIKTFLYEKDIKGGEPIPDSIRRNIQECREFVVLLSRYSLGRAWVFIEIGAAWALEKLIVAITDKVTPEEMPAIIAPYKAIDLNEFDKYVEELVNRAKGAEE